MRLPLKQRLKLIRQSVYAKVRLAGHIPLSIKTYEDIYLISMPQKAIYVPSPLRWKLYKYGWPARRNRLEREYGIGRYYTPKVGDIVFDIGANVGEFALIASSYGVSVRCFEPDPLAHKCLSKNVFDQSDVKIFDYVITDKNQDIDFYLAPEKADSSIFAVSDKSVNRAGKTLAAFMEQEGIAWVDFIKCDAEGAEPEVLKGAASVSHLIGVLAIDTGAERQGQRTGTACERIFRDWGFNVFEEKIGTRWITYAINPDYKVKRTPVTQF